MDFFGNRYHRINRTLLTLIGQWPYQSPKWRRCQQIIFHFNIISVMLVQGIKMFETRGDVDVMIECCTPMGVQVVACAKSINCIINHHKMKDLLERIKKDWSSLTNEDEIKILEKYAADGKKLSLAYAIFLFYTMAMYLLIPLAPQVLDIVLPLNESRQRVFLYRTEYYVEAESHYYPIMLHSYSATLMQVSIIVATDAIFAVYVQHTCGKLAIVGYRMERIAEDVSLKFEVEPAIEDDFKYRELIECIKAHQDAIKFAVQVESSYSKLFIFQLGMNMLLISISLLQLLTKLGQYEEMYRLIQFISGQMFHLFFNSWPGQKLINQSVNFRDSVYATGWYTSSLRSRRLLKIIMLSGTSPPKITASSLYDVSMENFAQARLCRLQFPILPFWHHCDRLSLQPVSDETRRVVTACAWKDTEKGMFELQYRTVYRPIYYSFEPTSAVRLHIDAIITTITSQTEYFMNVRRLERVLLCKQNRTYSIIKTVSASVTRAVMDFFRSRYHRINRTLLTLIGQWPYQSPKWQRLQQIFYHLNIISVMIVQGIKLFEARGDVDIVVECFTPMGVQAAACAKSINCIVNRHKMKDLLDRMKKDWLSLTNEQEIKILERYAADGKKLCFAYAIFLFGSMAIYLLIPVMPQLLDIVLPLNESRQRLFLYQTEYFIDAESHYYAILLHTYSGTVMTICTVVATDTMFAAYIQHICGKLAIISYRLERMAVNVSLKFDAKPAIEDDVKYQEFIECIKMHQDAIEYISFAVIIEASYTQLFLFQLGICILLISVSLLQLLTKFGQYGEMYRLIQFISAQMFHLFFMSWPGQKLINQTVNFRNSIYAVGWYTLSLRTRSLLKIVMLSGACPPKITACKHYDVSMENFARVVQTSISYFTVLASLR